MSDVTLIQRPQPRPTVSTPEGLIITSSRQDNYAGVCDVCEKQVFTLYNEDWCRVCPHCYSSDAHLRKIEARQAPVRMATRVAMKALELLVKGMAHVRDLGGYPQDLAQATLEAIADQGFSDLMIQVARKAQAEEAAAEWPEDSHE